MVKWTKENKNFAVRFSSYEPREFVDKFRGRCDWVWVYCFDRFALQTIDIQDLKKNFKICLVSPELQGGTDQDIKKFRELLKIEPDLICTKKPNIYLA